MRFCIISIHIGIFGVWKNGFSCCFWKGVEKFWGLFYAFHHFCYIFYCNCLLSYFKRPYSPFLVIAKKRGLFLCIRFCNRKRQFGEQSDLKMGVANRNRYPFVIRPSHRRGKETKVFRRSAQAQ